MLFLVPSPFNQLKWRTQEQWQSAQQLRISSSNTIQAGDSLTIGLDIGYGVVKAVTDTASIAFPSVMGHAREIKFQQETIQQKYPGDQISDEQGVVVRR